MRPILLPLAAMLPPAAAAAPPPPSAELARALAGRTAGRPTACIGPRRHIHSTIVDGRAVIYRESRRRWFVNLPDRGTCASLKPGRVLVTRSTSGRLCSGDLVRVVSLGANAVEYGACVLGEFTPYTLP